VSDGSPLQIRQPSVGLYVCASTDRCSISAGLTAYVEARGVEPEPGKSAFRYSRYTRCTTVSVVCRGIPDVRHVFGDLPNTVIPFVEFVQCMPKPDATSFVSSSVVK
jgi:hypothetical protein